MIGAVFNDKEFSELKSILKLELEEMILDLHDLSYDEHIKSAIHKRYKIVYGMYARFANKDEIIRYIKYVKRV